MPQFGGAAEKCTVCSKTVYLAEKIVVEDKEDKKTFHKTCLKCSHCKVTLTLGNYASMQGIFYCKPHFKQLFATKGNYDEGFGKDKHTKNWSPQAISASPASFVPVDKDEASGKKETPTTITSKFGRSTLNTEKCHACNKTVYATEKTVVEEKEGKKVFHKTCLKCSHCNVIVTLGNYASMQGVVYCKPHFKQLFAAKGNYDEGFGKEKASSKWDPQSNSTPATFVPVDKDDGPKEKKVTSDVASRFKGSAANNDKCSACGKTVYATERTVVEDKEDKQTFHKTCLRCSHCQVVVTLGNYASMQGVMYCKPHFKQLFAQKGNYDEGFGKEKHTKKWVDNNGDAQDGENNHSEPENSPRKSDRVEREREQQLERDAAKEREAKEKAERERVEKERAERQKAEKARAEQERAEKERAEKEREEQEEREEIERAAKLKAARLAREKEEKEREEEREREEKEEREREEREREEQEKEEQEQEREEQEMAERKRRREIEQQEEREREEREEQEHHREPEQVDLIGF